MDKIKCHGAIEIPQIVLNNADEIKLESYKTNTPKKFQIRNLHLEDNILMENLGKVIGIGVERLDFVYFSVCKGAEPHIDLLDTNKFESTTFVIPIILPKGISIITAQDESVVVKLNNVYEFNHEKIHSMELEDRESGCVVIMVAVKK